MTIDGRRLRESRAVLVNASGPPTLPVDEVVDVRVGSFASFDGDRHHLSYRVSSRGERTVVSVTSPGELVRVVELSVTGGGPATVRFGDLQTIRRLLPAPMADALERRLVGVADQSAVRLVAWTTGDVRRADRRRYDVDIGRAAPRPD